MCSVIGEQNGTEAFREVGAGCYDTQPPPSAFIQMTSQYLVHRVNAKNYPYATRYPQGDTLDAVLAKMGEPTTAQLKHQSGVINLSAPFEMKELLIYNRKLTADEIDTVEKYLNDKYQLY
jgi:hypothetical protein